jgi:lauroyl/myristoyl acyltransferase
VRAAEETIREEPESFLWSNRRWKHRPPDHQP